MRPRATIAAPLVLLVLVSSALGSVLDCGMHRSHESRAGHPDGAACHSLDPDRPQHGSGHQRAPSGAHDDDHHRSGPTCCHINLYNTIPLSVSGLETLQAAARAGLSHPLAGPTTALALVLASTRGGSGTGPPGLPFPNSPPFRDRPVFLAVSSLLL
jgi:hypothetical protein